MPARAMNNPEKEAAKLLKERGFCVFWFDGGPNSSGYYAMHPKLIMQYHIGTCTADAIKDITHKGDLQLKINL